MIDSNRNEKMRWTDSAEGTAFPLLAILCGVGDRLLPNDGRTAAAEHKLLNFSRCRFRQLYQKHDGVRHFEMREPLARERTQLGLLHACTRLAHYEGVRHLSPL